jgi:acyl-ACP thioesterase
VTWFEPLVPLPPVGRRFVGHRRVRLGDVTVDGRLRLDALTRYTQDVSNDDTTEAGLVDDLAWVVRRTVVDTFVPARFGEDLELVTFCGGLGRRWAERRLAVTGDAGARIEVATLWVHIDPTSGRPRQLSEQFLSLYGEAAQGRTVGARHGNPPAPDGAMLRRWPVRVADLDLFGHVNNAAYWAALEEVLADHPLTGAHRAVCEYGAGIRHGDVVDLRWDRSDDGAVGAWLVEGEIVHATFRAAPLPDIA